MENLKNSFKSSAFVCVQPLESGGEPSVPRWWYNSATGTCVQFMWDPDTIQNASPNNFRTVEHCESYCRDSECFFLDQLKTLF